MNSYRHLDVFMQDEKVGTLAVTPKRTIAFEYDKRWLTERFPLNPFSLPLTEKVFVPKYDPFEGLFGVFADSLPDGWGRLLVDRFLLQKGIEPGKVDSLNRLAIVGNSGMGALTYYPTHELVTEQAKRSYDSIAEECMNILKTDYSEDIDTLFLLGGSSGGARPKILTVIDGEDWIIKFPSAYDSADIGLEEYRYSECARHCGIEMSDTRLFPSDRCSGYFGTKRFDRRGERRIHMISVSALLETSHRIPNLDYNILMKLTVQLTDDYTDIEKLFRLMCFNVFAHNRDDHSKNFSFLYDRAEGKWSLSPAYDLTYSSSIGGEHATTVNGNGLNPGMKDIMAVADNIKLNHAKALAVAENIQETVERELGDLIRRKK